MFNFFVLKKIEPRSRGHKLSAFTTTGDGSNVEPRARHRRMVLNLSLAHGGECVNLAPRTEARACVSRSL